MIRDLTQALYNTDANTNTQTNSSNTEQVHKKKPIAHLLPNLVHLPHKTKAPQQQTVAQIQHHLEPTKKTVRTTLLFFYLSIPAFSDFYRKHLSRCHTPI